MVRLQDVLHRDGKNGGDNRPETHQTSNHIHASAGGTNQGPKAGESFPRGFRALMRRLFGRRVRPEGERLEGGTPAVAERSATIRNTAGLAGVTIGSADGRARGRFGHALDEARAHWAGTTEHLSKVFRRYRLRARNVSSVKARIFRFRLSGVMAQFRGRLHAGHQRWRHERAHRILRKDLGRQIAFERAVAAGKANEQAAQAKSKGRRLKTVLRKSARRNRKSFENAHEVLARHAEDRARRSDAVKARIAAAGRWTRFDHAVRSWFAHANETAGYLAGRLAANFRHAIDGLIRLARAVVPDREIIYRARGRVTHKKLTPTLQLSGAVASVAVVMWAGFASYYYISFDHMVQQRDREIASLKSAYRAIASMQEQTRKEVVKVTAELEATHGQMLEVIDRAGIPLRAKATPSAASKIKMAEVPRNTPNAYKRDMYKMRKNWHALAVKNADLSSAFVGVRSELENIVSAHGAVASHRDGLIQRVAELETEMANLRTSQEEVLKRVTARTKTNIVEVAQVIEKTGLDPKKLLARFQKNKKRQQRTLRFARGGPFIELASAKLPSADPLVTRVAKLDMSMDKWQDLQQILRMLPLASPVDSYAATSGFGKRRDPIRRMWSMHSGFDMANKIGTPILAAAPGKVVYAGWRGGNGRMIEIDHGLGITTRYLHLSEILVEEGDQIGFRHKIGLMGSSGRSTGSHLHYEVRIEGKAVNPRRFLKAGKFVFVGK